MFYVYSLCDPFKNDAPFYIGKGQGNRARQHLNGSADKENLFKAAKIKGIRNKGGEPVIKYLVSDIEDESEAYLLETKFIKQYGRYGLDENGILTNRLLEGRTPDQTGYKHSDETRAKIKAKMATRPPQSEETKRKRSESLKGRIISEEQRSKQSSAMKGRTMSLEEREKRRQANLGKKRGPYNWKISPEERSKNARKAGLRGGRPPKNITTPT